MPWHGFERQFWHDLERHTAHMLGNEKCLHHIVWCVCVDVRVEFNSWAWTRRTRSMGECALTTCARAYIFLDWMSESGVEMVIKVWHTIIILTIRYIYTCDSYEQTMIIRNWICFFLFLFQFFMFALLKFQLFSQMIIFWSNLPLFGVECSVQRRWYDWLVG